MADLEQERIRNTAKVLEAATLPGWSEAHGSSGCRLEVKTLSGVPAMRCALDFEATVEDFLDIVADPAQQSTYDPTLECNEIIKITTTQMVVLSKHKKAGIVSGRDFCTIFTRRLFSAKETQALCDVFRVTRDGNSVGGILAASDYHGRPGEVPETHGYVRGSVIFHAYLALPVQPKSSVPTIRVLHVSCIDPRGNVPKFLLGKMQTDACDRLGQLRQLCASKPPELRHKQHPQQEAPTCAPAAEKVAQPSPAAATPAAPAPTAPAPPEAVAAAAPAVSPAQKAVLSNLVELQKSGDWKMKKVLDGCLMEDAVVKFSDKKALRLATDVNCTLATFAKFLGDPAAVRKYDPNLDVFEKVSQDNRGVVIYTNYKQMSRFVTPRDFCSVTTTVMVPASEVPSLGLGDAAGGVLLQNSISVDSKPAQKNYVRGTIHVFGYIAMASAPNAMPIKVHCIMCVDPGGSIPNWLIESANADSCKKLATIRHLAEEMHKKCPATSIDVSPFTSVPSECEFYSCVDESELADEQDQLKDFHEDDIEAVCRPLVSLHLSTGWDAGTTNNKFLLQTMITPMCDKKAFRISGDFNCTLAVFQAVLGNTELVRKYDPTLEKIVFLDSPAYASVTYTSYRGAKMLVEARDFCTLTTNRLLTLEEGEQMGLYPAGTLASAFVQSSVDCKDMPPQKGYVRGVVHAYGFIAVAAPPGSSKIRVYHMGCVDPCGNIPASIVNSAISDSCLKLAAIQQLCEAAGQEAPTRSIASQQRSPRASVLVERLVKLNNSSVWSNPRVLGSCSVDETSLANVSNKCYRFQADYHCALESFIRVLHNQDSLRRYDPSVETVRMEPCKEAADLSVIHTSYRSTKRFISGRDFCTVTVSCLIGSEECKKLGIPSNDPKEAPACALVQASEDSSQVPQEGGYVRGAVHAFGFIAFATPADKTTLHIVHIACIDAKGSIPASMVDAAAAETSNKLIRMKVLCEYEERQREASQRPQAVETRTPAPAPRPAAPTPAAPAPAAPAPTEAVAAAAAPAVSPAQKAVLSNLIELQKSGDWKMKKVLDGCLMEDAVVKFSDKKALRLATDVNCTLATFAKFLGDPAAVRKYDPNLDVFEKVSQDNRGVVIYTNYKQMSRFVTPRDFCSVTTTVMVPASEVPSLGLGDAAGGVLLQNSISVDSKPAQKNYVRGTIHVFGYIAMASAPNAMPIKVHCIMCVDPGGSIPNWLIESANADSCKKLAIIRQLAEEAQRQQ